jgi:hypothetical protein
MLRRELVNDVPQPDYAINSHQGFLLDVSVPPDNSRSVLLTAMITDTTSRENKCPTVRSGEI